MKFKKNLYLTVLMLIVMAAWLCGCGNVSSDGKVIEDMATVDNGYKVYRIKKNCNELDSEEWKFQSVTPIDLVHECVDALCQDVDDKRYEHLLPEDVKIVDCDYDETDKQANIYFNNEYRFIDSGHEVLCRAAIVQTLTQFGGVIDYVQFYVNGESMLDADGEEMIMMASDFVNSTSADLKDLNETMIKLYFSSTDGRQLVAEDVNVRYYNTSPIERVIMESLISGPLTDGLLSTLPANTKLNSIYVQDGVCTVDLNQRFLEVLEGRQFEVRVYSVVNSLCTLEWINQVQILIDGVVSAYSEDGISLSEPLTENKELILKPSENIPVLETAEESENVQGIEEVEE